MIVSEENPNYTFNESGEFLVTLFVENAQGCTDVISQVIRVGTDLAIPNVITPNGDGKNDTFFITGLQPETSVQIFNRWGNLVFDASEYENDWQGTDISGRKLVPGVYTFRIETKLGEISHGFIHLND
jgi:gliding motility-associated-like protein